MHHLFSFWSLTHPYFSPLKRAILLQAGVYPRVRRCQADVSLKRYVPANDGGFGSARVGEETHGDLIWVWRKGTPVGFRKHQNGFLSDWSIQAWLVAGLMTFNILSCYFLRFTPVGALLVSLTIATIIFWMTCVDFVERRICSSQVLSYHIHVLNTKRLIMHVCSLQFSKKLLAYSLTDALSLQQAHPPRYHRFCFSQVLFHVHIYFAAIS